MFENYQVLKQLGVHSAMRTAPSNYSTELVGKSFAAELKKLIPDYNAFRRNKYDVFELMQDVFDEVLPRKVKEIYGSWADVVQLQHGQKMTFKKKVGRARAKSFITKVGLGGVFETFRLDVQEFDVPVEAIGGAAILDFERLLAGQEDLAEYMDVLLEGMQDRITQMIIDALEASINDVGRPANTKAADSTFTVANFNKLISAVKAYGDPVIMCTEAFADLLPANAISTVGGVNVTTERDAMDVRTYGTLRMYKGCPIVIIPQSFEDETNMVQSINPQFCYILPSAGAKIATVVLEGGTIVDEFSNKDRSMELSAYQKAGVALLHNNNWAIYQVTSLS